MKWYDVNEKLPETMTRVMVCREVKIDVGDEKIVFPSHDIGVLQGTGPHDRWKLESQQYCMLPVEPMLCANIVTHWCRLPKLPTTSRTEKK